MTQTEGNLRWRQKNPEAVHANKKRFAKAHRSEVSARQKRWRERIKEEIPLSPRAAKLVEEFGVGVNLT